MNSRLSQKEWLGIIKEFLALTGEDTFFPAQFVAWVKDHPEHRAYNYVWGSETDEEASFKYRCAKVRDAVRNIKITFRAPEVVHKGPYTITFKVPQPPQVVPALYSRRGNRPGGGGYKFSDPQDLDWLQEMAGQGAEALSYWLRRYESVCTNLGIDPEPIRLMRTALLNAEIPAKAAE